MSGFVTPFKPEFTQSNRGKYIDERQAATIYPILCESYAISDWIINTSIIWLDENFNGRTNSIVSSDHKN